jgi:hypothetical protein
MGILCWKFFKHKFVEGKVIIKKNKNHSKNLEKENIDIEKKKKNFKDLEFYKLIKTRYVSKP